jgi:hypothetical protein
MTKKSQMDQAFHENGEKAVLRYDVSESKRKENSIISEKRQALELAREESA